VDWIDRELTLRREPFVQTSTDLVPTDLARFDLARFDQARFDQARFDQALTDQALTDQALTDPARRVQWNGLVPNSLVSVLSCLET